MKIDTAGFGEIHGGHALLGCSDDEPSEYTDVVSKTDKPGYSPPGLEWPPFVSGFPLHGHYYVVKTFPDPSASRSGMVFSYSLRVTLDEISEQANFREILDLLPATASKPAKYKTIDVQLTNLSGELKMDRRLAECLVSVQSAESVVWLGDAGFQDAVSELWSCMWPETRAAFSFRLAFDPQDLNLDRPTIVLSPLQLESRWATHLVVQRSKQKTTIAGAALAQEPEGQALRALKESLGATISHARELRLLEQVYSSLSSPSVNTAELRSSLHLIARLCPDRNSGRPEKSQLLQLTAVAVASEDNPAEIRAFRNLKLEPFEDAPLLLASVEEWISRNILCRAQDETVPILELGFEKQNQLSGPIRAGTRMALQQAKQDEARVLWTWIEKVPNLSEGLFVMALSSAWTDRNIAETCPISLDAKFGPKLLALCEKYDLPMCYTAVAASTSTAEEAIRSYLRLHLATSHPAGLMLIDRVGGPSVVKFAKENDDPAAISLGVEALRLDPSLLGPVTPNNAGWLKLFTTALLSGVQVAAVVSNKMDSFALYDFVSQGGSLDNTVWSALSATEWSDISEYKQRSTIWAQIPTEQRDRFLNETAAGWLQLFEVQPEAEHELEPQLKPVVLRTLTRKHFGIGILIRLSYVLELDQDLFIELLQRTLVSSPISPFYAEKLGAAVAEKRWAKVANQLFGLSDARNDLNPALAKCLGLLNRWQRLRAIWLKNVNSTLAPSSDELWTALEELGVELYPWGPNDRDVWERAGGDAAAVRVQTSGLDSWHDVITQARRGGGGNVTPKTLAAAMRSDYGWNDVLRKVSQCISTK